MPLSSYLMSLRSLSRLTAKQITRKAKTLSALCRWLRRQPAIFLIGIRNERYRSYFALFFIWNLTAATMLLATFVFIFGGVFAHTGPILESELLGQQLSPINIARLLLSIFYVLLSGTFFSPRVRSMLDKFIEIHAFYEWGTRHHLVSSQLNRFRISQVAVRQPSLFTYAFSGQTMIVIIGKSNKEITLLPGEVQETPVLSAPTLLIDSQTNISSQEKQIDQIVVQSSLEEASSTKQKEIFFRIVLDKTVELFIREETTQTSKGDKELWIEVQLNNITYEAIIAYLATRDNQDWVLRDQLLQAIYRDTTTKERDNFLDDRRRIQNIINKKIEEAFPHQAARLRTEKKQFALFENRDKKGIGPQWRLTARCCIKGTEELIRWHQMTRKTVTNVNSKAANDIVRSYRIEDWRRIGQHLIKHYSNNYLLQHPENQRDYTGGYLIQHFSDDPFKLWAPTIFQQYREKYIYILEYIASCEERVWRTTQEEAYLNKAAYLYQECTYAATCEPIHQASGEYALRKCLQIYHEELQDAETAELIYEVYKSRIEKLVVGWIPEEKTKELIYQLRIEL